MKKFKQFRAEQQYITEVGPFASAMMAAMGLVGLGVGGYKLFKKAKEGIKGYRESKAEKKANRESGVEITVKKINPDTGEEYEELVPLSGSEASLDSDGVEKKRKELQKKYDNMEKGKHKAAANANIRKVLGKGPDEIITKDDQKKGMGILKDPEGYEKDKKDKEDKETKDATEKEKKGKADAAKSVSDWMGSPVEDIPDGIKSKVKEKERKELGGHKDVLAYKDRWDLDSVKGWKKWFDDPEDKDDFEYVNDDEYEKRKQVKAGQKDEPSKTTGKVTGKKTNGALKDLAKQQGITSQRILNFGEFIAEDVMKDLKKASKSRKDSEIALDDGSDVPIDPLTSQILIKYIEGLSSSEKNRTIQQIQRTERAFMKVLGKAHESI